VKRGGVSMDRLKILVSMVIVPVMVVLIAFGCASTSSVKRENRSYNQAVKKDTIEAYTEFIAKNPDGVHVEDAKKRIVKLEWDKAEKANTVEAYQGFIAKYKGYPSDSDYIGLAQRNLSKLNEQSASSKSDKKRGNKKGKIGSKITLLKRSNSSKDEGAKPKLTSLNKEERQRLSKTFFTAVTNMIVRVWRAMYSFFERIFSFIFNFRFRGDEIGGGRVVRATD
jgi:hypothetical protein